MRIGLILPSGNVNTEPEFWRIAPHGVSIHSSRILASGCDTESLQKMDLALERCVAELQSLEPDVIFYGCTSSSFLNGAVWEHELCRRIQAQAPAARAVTAAGAVCAAMEALDVRRITILTPYVAEVARSGTEFFRGVGYDIVSEAHMGCSLIRDICRLQPDQILRTAMVTVQPDTQLLFLSCTNLPTLELIPELERTLGIPVISSNQAGIWAALRAGTVSVEVGKGQFGQLFQHL